MEAAFDETLTQEEPVPKGSEDIFVTDDSNLKAMYEISLETSNKKLTSMK